MKKYFLASSLILLLSCSRDAPEATMEDAVQALQQQALQDSTAWELLSSLTTEVGPRGAGTEGDAKGVEWAVAQMKRLGFDRVWLEHVDFPYWERRAESGRISSPETVELDLTALGGTPGTNGVLQGEIVHFKDLAALRSADPATVQDRIVFISARMRQTQTGIGYSETVPQRSQGPFVASEKGAKALIIRSVGTDYENSAPHTGNISSSTPGTPVPAAALSHASADQLVELLSAGSTVSVELDLDVGFAGRGVSANVIGEFDGTGDDDSFILIGGHLDSWDLGTGAHDDGAGVVITMTAATLVARQEQRPHRGIRVVLYANEEQGIYGGKTYAAAHAGEIDRHLLGSESDLGAGRIYTFSARVRPEAQASLNELKELLAPLDIEFDAINLAGGGADIGQIRKLGVPVIDLRHDASRYFDLHHTRNDVLENVNPEDLAFNVAAYVTLIQWVTNSDIVFGPVAPSE